MKYSLYFILLTPSLIAFLLCNVACKRADEKTNNLMRIFYKNVLLKLAGEWYNGKIKGRQEEAFL
jgi:hypothetical protein